MELKDVKIGMRVVAIAPCGFKSELIGKRGTVRAVLRAGQWPVGVEFDEKFSDGHTLGGLLPEERSRGRWCESKSLMPCGEVDIAISVNGHKTTIKGEINGRKVDTSVRCSKEDTPNAYVGALMALNKAFGVHLGLAKTGENVIVTNPIDPRDKYSLGDIVQMDNDIQGTNTKNDKPVTLFAVEYAIIDDLSILAKPGKTRKVVCVAVDRSGSSFVVGNMYVVDPDNTISLNGRKVVVVNSPREHWLADGGNKFVVINEDGKDAD